MATTNGLPIPLPPPDPTLLLLLQWLEFNEVWLDPRLRIARNAERPEAGYGVWALADVPYGVTVTKTPKTAVLSIRTCALSSRLYPLVKDRDANIGLAVALLSEQLLGRESRFWGYLQSLPPEGADIGMFWPFAGPEGEEAVLWLRGTEADSLMRGSLISDLEKTYEEVVRPALKEWAPSLEGFRKAYSLVSSRAFQVDFWHGVGLVPLADAFNHSEENDVFMETDFAVCPTCGSLGPCPHPSHTPRHASPWDEPMTCDMVTYSPIQKGKEVFNSYDEKGLGNAHLLVHYGFLLEGNGEDRLKWEVAELADVLEGSGGGGNEVGEERWKEVRKVGREMTEEMEDLEGIVTPSESEEPSACEEEGGEEEGGEGEGCWIDAEGRLSQSLFLRLFARNSINSTASVRNLLHHVLAVMHLVSGDGGAKTAALVREMPAEVLDTLRGIAEDVEKLCTSRLGRMYKPELTTSELSAMLDASAFPRSRRCMADVEQTQLGPRVKLAVSYALTERLMLETCATYWQELKNALPLKIA